MAAPGDGRQRLPETGATACYVNNPDTISVSGGYLNLSVRQVAPFTCADGSNSFTTSYEAGMVSTYGLFDQTYGAYEVSAKLPPAVIAGLQETFWLYPQNLTYGGWPASGEIDFAEFYSDFPGLDVPYVHYSQSSTDPMSRVRLRHQPGLVQHVRRRLDADVDHRALQRTALPSSTIPSTGSEPFDRPFFIALTQALGVGTDAFVPGAPRRCPPPPRSTGSAPGPRPPRGRGGAAPPVPGTVRRAAGPPPLRSTCNHLAA